MLMPPPRTFSISALVSVPVPFAVIARACIAEYGDTIVFEDAVIDLCKKPSANSV